VAAPVVYAGTVALGGSNVTLATSPAYVSFRIGSVIFGNTGTTAVAVSIKDNASPTPNVLVEAVVPAGGSMPLDLGGLDSDVLLLAGNTASIVTPAGTGTLTYEVTFH
jgi:hypothetical protein